MPVIIRKGFCFASLPAAVFCMAVFLCGAQMAGAAPDAGGNGAPAAKKKIALAQFDVANTLHVDDISNIYDGLPSMLSSRLEESGEFLAAYTGRSIPAEAGEAQREAIIQITGEAGAQFLVSGTVVNAGITQKEGFWGTSIGRHIEVELAVYDGLTGARLLMRRLGEQAKGEVRVGNDKPFGSSIFLETELGKATNRLVDSAAKDIRAALKNVPFSAHIVKVDGKRILLDAGGDSLLKPGDILVAYVRDAGTIAGLNGSMPGVTVRAADTVTLTQVQQQYSIGELSGDAAELGVRVGNIARVDPHDQRSVVAKQIAAQQIVKAQQEAREEAERVKKKQEARAEAERVKAEQDKAARIKAEKEAKAQAAAEAKAAKLKAAQEARARRLSAAQEARAREKAQAVRAAARAKQEADKAEAARIKAEKEAQAKKQAAVGGAPPGDATQQPAGSGVAQTKTGPDAAAQQPATDEAAKNEPASSVIEIEWSKPKPSTPLKLKQIKP